jgi:hypothetical protein
MILVCSIVVASSMKEVEISEELAGILQYSNVLSSTLHQVNHLEENPSLS